MKLIQLCTNLRVCVANDPLWNELKWQRWQRRLPFGFARKLSAFEAYHGALILSNEVVSRIEQGEINERFYYPCWEDEILIAGFFSASDVIKNPRPITAINAHCLINIIVSSSNTRWGHHAERWTRNEYGGFNEYPVLSLGGNYRAIWIKNMPSSVKQQVIVQVKLFSGTRIYHWD